MLLAKYEITKKFQNPIQLKFTQVDIKFWQKNYPLLSFIKRGIKSWRFPVLCFYRNYCVWKSGLHSVKRKSAELIPPHSGFLAMYSNTNSTICADSVLSAWQWDKFSPYFRLDYQKVRSRFPEEVVYCLILSTKNVLLLWLKFSDVQVYKNNNKLLWKLQIFFFFATLYANKCSWNVDFYHKVSWIHNAHMMVTPTVCHHFRL